MEKTELEKMRDRLAELKELRDQLQMVYSSHPNQMVLLFGREITEADMDLIERVIMGE